MRNEASTQAALLEHTADIDAMLDNYLALCDYMVLSIAFLSFAHLCQRAESFAVTADERTINTAHRLLHLFVAQRDATGNRAVGSVFWALARLNIMPDSIGPSYEAALADMFLATMHECNVEGIGNMLWVMGTLNSNPLNGSLLKSLIKRLQVCLSEPNIDYVRDMQVQPKHLTVFVNTAVWSCCELSKGNGPRLANMQCCALPCMASCRSLIGLHNSTVRNIVYSTINQCLCTARHTWAPTMPSPCFTWLAKQPWHNVANKLQNFPSFIANAACMHVLV